MRALYRRSEPVWEDTQPGIALPWTADAAVAAAAEATDFGRARTTGSSAASPALEPARRGLAPRPASKFIALGRLFARVGPP